MKVTIFRLNGVELYTLITVFSLVAVIEDNPYTLLRVAPDMLFGTADTLAEHLGITGSDSRRLEASLEWILRSLDNQGHTCLPVDQLIGCLDDLLQTDADDIANFIEGVF